MRFGSLSLSPLLLFVTLSLATPAHAFNNRVEAGIGQFTIKDSEPGVTVSVNPIGSYIGWVGSFNPYIAVEIRLGATAQDTTPLISLQASSFSALFRPTLPIGNRLEIYGLTGISSVSIQRQVLGYYSQTIARAGLSYGLGANVRILPHMRIGAEWLSYMSNVDYGSAVKISLSGVTANFSYQF